MWLFVEPFDVWLFRDARPFTAGEHVRATGMFPPLPTTFQGVIRSAALVRALRDRGRAFEDFKTGAGSVEDLVNLWGGPNGFGAFSLRGPFLARRAQEAVEVWLPSPKDLLVRGRDDEARFVVAAPEPPRSGEQVRGGLVPVREEDGLKAHERFQWHPWPGASVSAPTETRFGLASVPEDRAAERQEVQPAPPWLPLAQFRDYLLGQLAGVRAGDGSEESNLFQWDLRVGIERDRDTGTASHGKLYLAHFVRPAPGVGLVAEVTLSGVSPGPEATFGDAGLLALGGEARGGRYERVSRSPLEAIDGPGFREALGARLRKCFKLILITPGVFRHGWCPDFLDPATLTGQIGGVNVRLVGAVVDKPVPVAGRDLAGNRPRALRWAVPAGSVYALEVLSPAPGDWPQRVLGACHGRSIATGADQRVGMALAFVGAV